MSSPEFKEEQFNAVISYIEDDGYSLRKALRQPNTPSSKKFYEWLDQREDLRKRYARACEKRADAIFDEILEIADEAENDTVEITEDGVVDKRVNHENIQRSKLRVDARKWVLAKMNPKKYSDRTNIDHTSNGETMNIISLGSGLDPNEATS